MSKTIIVIVVLLLVILGLYYFTPTSWKFWQSQAAAPIEALLPTPTSLHEAITAKHQFKNGTHIVAGEVNLPTPCDALSTSARIAESFPEQVTIDFTTKISSDICAQVITPNRFKVDFAASENATIKATWNGQPVELKLIPVSQGEDLSKFELYIKG